MKFEEKYELLESLTSGKVETFVANDKLRGERVVVHILHCEPQKPNQPTVQWVLDSFRRVAPEPAGLVLETGRYGGTLYAYLVTKIPDKAVLRSWVQQYEAQAKDTQEFLLPEAKKAAEADTVTAEIRAPQMKPAEPKLADPAPAPPASALVPPAAPVPVQFTQVFREFGAHPTPGASGTPPSEPELPNLNLAENPSGLHAAPGWDAVAPATPLPSKDAPKFSSPAAPRRDDARVQSFPVESPMPALGDSAKPGEFTSFFRGPFHVDGPTETPSASASVTPRDMEPPRKSVGAFTEIFGAITSPDQSQTPSKAGTEPPSPVSSSGPSSGFTDLFRDSDILPPKPVTAAPPPPAGLPRSVSNAPAVPPVPPREAYVPPAPVAPVSATPVFTTLPPPPVPPRPPAVNPAPADGATSVFSTPTPSAPVASEPVLPSGPSPYTQIISVRPPNAAGGQAGSQKQAPPAATAFPPPSKPPLPTIAPPAMPAAPPMERFAAPAPPPIKASRVEPPAKPPVSYWPLVIVLTALLFIAVLLVLYFVLKH